MTITKRFTPVNYSPGRFGSVIDRVLIHTMDGTLESTWQVFSDPNGRQVSAHYGIGLDGSVTQYVDEGNTAWHSGNWNMNTRSVGIEHEDGGNYNDSVRSDAEYETSAQLVADLCRRYSIPADRGHILKHSEVTATGCPDGLDIDRIVARANQILSAIVTATAPVADIHAAYPVVEWAGTVKVVIQNLQVRIGPGTNYAGFQGNTPDGLVHAGDLVQIMGYVHTTPATVGSVTSDLWLKTLNELGQSHWIWAAGTNFVLPAPAEAPAPEPQPEPVEPTPTPEPAPEPAKPSLTVDYLGTPEAVRLVQTGIVRNLTTGKDIAQVPVGTELPIVGTVLADELYLVTRNMADNWEHTQHGIAARYFKDPRPVDGLSKVPVAGESTLSTLPVHYTVQLSDLGHLARMVAKLLHLIK